MAVRTSECDTDKAPHVHSVISVQLITGLTFPWHLDNKLLFVLSLLKSLVENKGIMLGSGTALVQTLLVSDSFSCFVH